MHGIAECHTLPSATLSTNLVAYLDERVRYVPLLDESDTVYIRGCAASFLGAVSLLGVVAESLSLFANV